MIRSDPVADETARRRITIEDVDLGYRIQPAEPVHGIETRRTSPHHCKTTRSP
jgi:hypothetical protein